MQSTQIFLVNCQSSSPSKSSRRCSCGGFIHPELLGLQHTIAILVNLFELFLKRSFDKNQCSLKDHEKKTWLTRSLAPIFFPLSFAIVLNTPINSFFLRVPSSSWSQELKSDSKASKGEMLVFLFFVFSTKDLTDVILVSEDEGCLLMKVVNWWKLLMKVGDESCWWMLSFDKSCLLMQVVYWWKLSIDESCHFTKFVNWWKLSYGESCILLKVVY